MRELLAQTGDLLVELVQLLDLLTLRGGGARARQLLLERGDALAQSLHLVGVAGALRSGVDARRASTAGVGRSGVASVRGAASAHDAAAVGRRTQAPWRIADVERSASSGIRPRGCARPRRGSRTGSRSRIGRHDGRYLRRATVVHRHGGSRAARRVRAGLTR